MKKICFLLFFTAVMSFSLAACGKDVEVTATPAEISAAIVEKMPSDISMVELGSDRLESYYTIDMTKVEDFSVYIEGSGGFADEIAVFKMKSEKDVDEAKAAVEKRIQKQRKDFEGYVPEEVEKIDSNSVISEQNFLLFVISDNDKAAEDAFKAYFK